ncbi:alpha/beta fold hydrolase [Nocardioides marmoriginsengisoli]|uniref:Alpha/beta fold hydrolase n=1 Tax=Nocardioides marmoriginsengisoli TaxID=661483 RepID=A0A3N0CD97_9ACTN|nr:alpha/beta fold hydrolase [Nocardioides marmoriginsengisoli]RNL61026.1 alpha/beta fold hydrolase [Nocardioides marmoriginsengisoli]
MTSLTSLDAADLFRTAPDRYVDTGNGEVAVRSVGTGPDLLLVHGWPVSGATFRELLPHLAPHLRCHVIDLVGAGDSHFDRTARLGIPEHAAAVRHVVDALGIDDLAVVGHDSGGLVARHALAGDERVRAWGLLDTELPPPGSLRFRSFLALRHLPRVESVLALAFRNKRLRRHGLILGDSFDDRSRLDGEFAEFFLRPLHEDADRRWAAGELLRNFGHDALAALPELHRRIEVPVQLVYGGRDRFFPHTAAQEMTRTFGGTADLHVVERGRLFTHEEFAAETAAALLPVLVPAP